MGSETLTNIMMERGQKNLGNCEEQLKVFDGNLEQKHHIKNSEKRVLAWKNLECKIKSQELACKLKDILVNKARVYKESLSQLGDRKRVVGISSVDLSSTSKSGQNHAFPAVARQRSTAVDCGRRPFEGSPTAIQRLR
ncbi:hypothetical protein WN943_027035 [Citrus x changshan-huyou]